MSSKPTRKTAPKSTTRKRTPRSDAHKAALAKGREEGRAVRLYLEAIESTKPRRGRRRSSDSVTKRLATVEEELATASALSRLHLLQEQRDLEAALSQVDETIDLTALEADFVVVAKGYGERKGIDYASWRAAGVAAAALQQAGISRSGR